MREDGEGFGLVEIPAEYLEEDWRETPRREILERLIVVLDGAKSEAEEVGDENYARYVDEALFPFLRTELEKAEAPRCAVGSATNRPCRRPAAVRVNSDDEPDMCTVHALGIEVQNTQSEITSALENLAGRLETVAFAWSSENGAD